MLCCDPLHPDARRHGHGHGRREQRVGHREPADRHEGAVPGGSTDVEPSEEGAIVPSEEGAVVSDEGAVVSE